MSLAEEEEARDRDEELNILLKDCFQGEPPAWRGLLERVRRLAVKAGREDYHLGREDAEDMAQVVQLRVVERLHQLRRPEAFLHWVRSLIHRAALDTLGQQKPVVSLEGLATPESSTRDLQIIEPYDRIDLQVDVDRALSRLPLLYREPIRLYLLEGLPQEEVGRRLGRARGTVASQIARGLQRLRRSLPRSPADGI